MGESYGGGAIRRHGGIANPLNSRAGFQCRGDVNRHRVMTGVSPRLLLADVNGEGLRATPLTLMMARGATAATYLESYFGGSPAALPQGRLLHGGFLTRQRDYRVVRVTTARLRSLRAAGGYRSRRTVPRARTARIALPAPTVTIVVISAAMVSVATSACNNDDRRDFT